MDNFQTALALDGLGDMIETQYGKWGHFTQQAADVIVKLGRQETDEPTADRMYSVMSMVAVTWMNESTFAFAPKPNENNKRWNPWNFDVGPFQLNVQWTVRMAWQADFYTADQPWKDVFGTSFYEADGVTPCTFNGATFANGVIATRRLLYLKTDDHDRVVRFTGPKAQPHRSKDWQKFGPLFKQFFQAYNNEAP